ncbi:DNA-J related domain-containing protein [Celerinatantimonas sp. MCCC 1A17872]|uniref:DNA-J related domain-containing protein n=1 Tax=Celerinatantimonas sp. MCCC 1A17872 TaxID=3177514 RepID=UPI0038C3E4C1
MNELNSNPLNSDILKILSEQMVPMSEYQLLKKLQAHSFLNQFNPENSDLKLFQRHFVVMNALYQLRDMLFNSGYTIAIGALNIELLKHHQAEDFGKITKHDALRAYYLDWQQLKQTQIADVEKLLNDFWNGFNANHADALTILQLPDGANQSQIKQRYKEMALKHHPDRGGDAKQFEKITQAYQQLKH